MEVRVCKCCLWPMQMTETKKYRTSESKSQICRAKDKEECEKLFLDRFKNLPDNLKIYADRMLKSWAKDRPKI